VTTAAYLNTNYLCDVATNTGWDLVASHIREKTDVRQYPNAHHLAEYGWSKFGYELGGELVHLLKEHPPRKVDTLKTLKELAAMISGLDTAIDDCLVISDGLS